MKNHTHSKAVQLVARRADVHPDTAAKVLDALAAEVAANARLHVHGFGAFRWVLRAARTIRNFATGEHLEVPEQHSVAFRPGRALRKAVNGRGT